MKHPNREILKKYAQRQVSAAQMSDVILHLENCANCFSELQKLLPPVEEHTIALFSENESKVFHLDYDEHLRPFVDREADAVLREIVESHTQTCANCAFELRELKEFAESLRLREIEKNLNRSSEVRGKINGLLHRISHHLTSLKFALPAAAIVCIIAAVWIFSSSEQTNTEKVNLEKTNQSEARKIENPPTRPAVKSVESDQLSAESLNRNAKNPPLLKADSPAAATSQPLEKVKAVKSAKNESDELKYLPTDLQAIIQKTLQSQTITFPAYLSAIRENLHLRSEDNRISIPISPRGEAVRSATPNFRWSRFADPGEKYVVEIFDKNHNTIAVSPGLDDPFWTPPTPLPRGTVYGWEIRIEQPDDSKKEKTASGKFKILSSAENARLDKLPANRPFVRGIIFASFGLLTEAENELKKAIRNGENIKLSEKLLIQIERAVRN